MFSNYDANYLFSYAFHKKTQFKLDKTYYTNILTRELLKKWKKWKNKKFLLHRTFIKNTKKKKNGENIQSEETLFTQWLGVSLRTIPLKSTSDEQKSRFPRMCDLHSSAGAMKGTRERGNAGTREGDMALRRIPFGGAGEASVTAPIWFLIKRMRWQTLDCDAVLRNWNRCVETRECVREDLASSSTCCLENRWVQRKLWCLRPWRCRSCESAWRRFSEILG